jgi:hypothetical protein
MVLATDDPPDLAFVLPERVMQGAEEQGKVDVVSSCFDMKLSEVEPNGHLKLGN